MTKLPKNKPEDQRRDELLKRLLETPPKPHKPAAKAPPKRKTATEKK
ncbi:MAG: hypothetical protein WEC00_07835 [Dongiaceae bacterium]